MFRSQRTFCGPGNWVPNWVPSPHFRRNAPVHSNGPSSLRAIQNGRSAQGGVLAAVTAPKPKVGATTLKQELKRADVTFEASFVGGSSYVVFRGAIWTYLYDRSGHLCSMRNPLGAERRLMYDADRNVTSYLDPLGNESLATFDARGNLLTQIDPLGRVRSWTVSAHNNHRLPCGLGARLVPA